jgi:quinol monooxygenase YgiN
MTQTITWILQSEIRTGMLASLKELVIEMTEATHQDEPDALVYEYYIDAEGATCHILERYADSEAALLHLKNFAAFEKSFMAALKPVRMTVYGSPDEKTRQALTRMGSKFYDFEAGFAR